MQMKMDEIHGIGSGKHIVSIWSAHKHPGPRYAAPEVLKYFKRSDTDQTELKRSKTEGKKVKLNSIPIYDTMVDPVDDNVIFKVKIGAVGGRACKRPKHNAKAVDWYKYYEQIDVARLDNLNEQEKKQLGVDIVHGKSKKIYVANRFNCFQSRNLYSALGCEAANVFLQGRPWQFLEPQPDNE